MKCFCSGLCFYLILRRFVVTLQLLQQILQSVDADVMVGVVSVVVVMRVPVQETLALLRPPPFLHGGADQVRRGQEEDAAGCEGGKLRPADREAPPIFLERRGGAIADELVDGAGQITLKTQTDRSSSDVQTEVLTR